MKGRRQRERDREGGRETQTERERERETSETCKLREYQMNRKEVAINSNED